MPSTITFRLPTELHADAIDVARSRGQTLSELVRDAVALVVEIQAHNWLQEQREREHPAREQWRTERAHRRSQRVSRSVQRSKARSGNPAVRASAKIAS